MVWKPTNTLLPSLPAHTNQNFTASHVIQDITGTAKKNILYGPCLGGKKDLWIYFTLLVLYTSWSSLLHCTGSHSLSSCRLHFCIFKLLSHNSEAHGCRYGFKKTSCAAAAVNTKHFGCFVVAVHKITTLMLKNCSPLCHAVSLLNKVADWRLHLEADIEPPLHSLSDHSSFSSAISQALVPMLRPTPGLLRAFYHCPLCISHLLAPFQSSDRNRGMKGSL